MSIKKCKECDCPQISNLYHSFDVHYKNCSIPEERVIGRKRIVPLDEWKERLNKFIEYRKDDIQYLKDQIIEISDCIKNTCLDEVYECRWDCSTVPA